jgi:hypothetical protein
MMPCPTEILTDKKAIEFLIQQKILFVNYATYACMWWWVSSILFRGSILGAIWSKQEKLKDRRPIIWLGVILFIFFSSIIIFGFVVILYLGRSRAEINALAANLKFGSKFFSN